MKKEIIINSAINEVRVAITEDGHLAEFFIEMPSKERFIGNIYYGKVSKIATGINAAFINIGLNQDAFLHFSDVNDGSENSFLTDEEDSEELDEILVSDEIENIVVADVIDEEVLEENDEPIQTDKHKKSQKNLPTNKKQDKQATFKTKSSGEIPINLVEGQNVYVQVVREAYAHKGVKVTTKVALPGRYTVLLPKDNMIGVSRKISSFQERRRLRQLARNVLPEGFGVIIRTAARGKTEDELRNDWKFLLELWGEIDGRAKKAVGPSLIYQDLSLANSIVRDLFTTDVQRIVIDSKKLYRDLMNYIKRVSPHLESKLELFDSDRSIFEEFGIERELAKTYRRKVSLYSGGDIVIDQTEALTVIDVNSGRSQEQEQELNAYKTNIDAAKEIARQIRLRDIGGIIIVDFIDMGNEGHRKKLFNEMRKEISKDRAKVLIYPLTQLGLMQITRQRINQNIVEKITEICPHCKGTGRVTSKAVLINEIERWLKNFRKISKEFRLILNVHPNIAEYITEGTFSTISKLMIKYFVKIKVQQNENVQVDQFRFFSIRQQKDITNEF